MGKGKKKNKSIWDLTPEEQQKSAEVFYTAEQTGDLSVFDFGGKIKPKRGSSGLFKDVEDAIAADMGLEDTRTDDPSSFLEQLIGNSEEDDEIPKETNNIIDETLDNLEAAVKQSATSKEDIDDETDHIFRIDYDPILKHATISDGVVSTSVFLPASGFVDLLDGYKEEDPDDAIKTLVLYMISCSHPTCLLTRSEFEEMVEDVSSFNEDKYAMFITPAREPENMMIACYLIDKNSLDEFHEYLTSVLENTEDIVKVYAHMAMICEETGHMFYNYDEKYTSAFYRCEDHNRKLDFSCEFLDDSTTEFLDKNSENDESEIHVMSYPKFQNECKNLLEDIVDGYFEDPNEEDDEEDEDPETAEEEVQEDTDAAFNESLKEACREEGLLEETEEAPEEADPSELLSGDMEMVSEKEHEEVKPIDKVPVDSDDEDMVVPVQRKNPN